MNECKYAECVCVVTQICRIYSIKQRLLVMHLAFATRRSLSALSWCSWVWNDFQVAWQMVNMGPTKTERWFGRQDVMWWRRTEMTWTTEEVRSFYCHCVTAKFDHKSFVISCSGSREALGPQTMPLSAICTSQWHQSTSILTWKVWITLCLGLRFISKGITHQYLEFLSVKRTKLKSQLAMQTKSNHI